MCLEKSFWPGDAWPEATVVYELNSNLNKENIRVFHEAAAEFESKTCIKFRPRVDNETDYVSIERFDLTCGVAHMCRWGGYQYVMIGGACFNKTILIHELGHSLCLGHEDTRVDRDDYVDLTPCQLYPNPDKFDTRGHLYDYWSIMHYQCGFCEGGAGWPKMEGVTVENCGQQFVKGDGLSVLDADKLNDFYDCQGNRCQLIYEINIYILNFKQINKLLDIIGCHRHRWRRTNNLTETDLQALLAFGQTNDGTPLYLCRAYVGAEIAPGKYNLQEDICYLPFNGTEFQVRERVQVFTVPMSIGQQLTYQPIGLHSADKETLIRVGRSVNGITQYAAVATVEVDGITEVAIGKIYESDMTKAYIPVQGEEIIVTDFMLVACA